jgi:hypothetical protein
MGDVMIGRTITFSIFTLLSSSLSAQSAELKGNRNLHVTVDFNYITRASNHWVSDGAFIDEGTVSHETEEYFKGPVAKVTDSPEGQYGTFTWTFSKAYAGSGKYGDYQSNGAWEMTGGTGKYEGITGRGIMKGTLNVVTGQIHDELMGTVDCPKC